MNMNKLHILQNDQMKIWLKYVLRIPKNTLHKKY